MKRIEIYSDESYSTNMDKVENSSDYSSICMVAIEHQDHKKIEDLRIFSEQSGYNNSELAWKNIRYPNDARVIKELIDEIYPLISKKILKIHSVVFKREELKNIESVAQHDFIYFESTKWFLNHWFQDGTLTIHCTHDKGGPNLKNASKYLSGLFSRENVLVNKSGGYTEEEFRLIGLEETALHIEMNIAKKEEYLNLHRADSVENRLIQLADLFGGIHACSWRYNQFNSNKKRVQLEIINHFKGKFQTCDVSGLKLFTGRKSNPNLWRWKSNYSLALSAPLSHTTPLPTQTPLTALQGCKKGSKAHNKTKHPLSP